MSDIPAARNLIWDVIFTSSLLDQSSRRKLSKAMSLMKRPPRTGRKLKRKAKKKLSQSRTSKHNGHRR